MPAFRTHQREVGAYRQWQTMHVRLGNLQLAQTDIAKISSNGR